MPNVARPCTSLIGDRIHVKLDPSGLMAAEAFSALVLAPLPLHGSGLAGPSRERAWFSADSGPHSSIK